MNNSTNVQNNVVQDDPWAIADNAKPREFEYFGQVKADVWFGYFPGGGAKPVPFDPNQHPQDKRTVMVEVQIIPIAEQEISFDIQQSYTDWSADWTRITLPSIKALGLDGLKSLNNRFAKAVMVDGKRERKDESGNKTGEFYKTLKFVELYSDQAACVAAYSGQSFDEDQPTANATPSPPNTEANPFNQVQGKQNGNSAEKETALKFARVVVENSARGKNDPQAVINAVSTNIAGMPMINKYFTAESPEILSMIQEVMSK